MVGVDEFVGRRWRLCKNSKPSKRIFALVVRQHTRRNAWPADPVESVTARDEVAVDLFIDAILATMNRGMLGREVVNTHIFDFEVHLAGCSDPGIDQVFDDLGLGVDGDSFSSEFLEVDAVASSIKSQLNPVMWQPLTLHALA